MAALTFETSDAWLTLEQDGAQEAATISLRLSLSSTPSVYVSNGQTLLKASWTMVVSELARADGGTAPGSLSYTDNDGKTECLLLVKVSSSRFCELLGMFKGGQASEITVEVDGMVYQDDYSSHWNTDVDPTLAVLRVRFEFPLPQSEA